MRSAGCVINDIADRHIDSLVLRTKDRPLASGRLTVAEALIVLGVLLLIALGLAIQLNRLSLALCGAGLFLAVFYPYTKRYLPFPQLVLGIAFGWGAVIAWAAVRNTVETPAYLIFLANIFWATAYDTIYAFMDEKDDLRVGIHSTAILFGRHAWWVVGLLFIAFLGSLAMVGWTARLSFIYFSYLLMAAGYCLYQTLRIKTSLDSREAFALFKSNVGVGLFVLSGLLMDLTLQRLSSLVGQ
jgi:4-hydroxybenzoate polyprenyltransferase